MTVKSVISPTLNNFNFPQRDENLAKLLIFDEHQNLSRYFLYLPTIHVFQEDSPDQTVPKTAKHS